MMTPRRRADDAEAQAPGPTGTPDWPEQAGTRARRGGRIRREFVRDLRAAAGARSRSRDARRDHFRRGAVIADCPADGTLGMQRSAGNAAVTELLRARPGVQRATSADEIAAGSAATRVTSPEARPVLARGASGPAVATLQAALAATTDMPLTADGEYGPQTAARVCLIQRYLALKVDGIVGPDMWRALDVLGEPFADEARDGKSGEGAPSASVTDVGERSNGAVGGPT